MSKTSETKNKILSLLAEEDMRLTDLIPKLNLSSPTVIQHLKELEEMDLIKKVNDSHFKNVKYYTLNKRPDLDATESNLMAREKNSNRSRLIFIPILVVLVLGGLLYFFMANNSQHSQNQNPMALELLMSNPINVPNGTSDIVLSYSAVNVHINGTMGGQWIRINSGGEIDLMSSANSSVFMGHVEIPQGEYIDAATFNITSVSILMNNTSYSAYVPKSTVDAYIQTNHTKINETMGLLVDFSPTISRMNDSKQALFALTYSVKTIKI